jgi:hypothetical protein
MIVNQASLFNLRETFNIKISDAVLVKLEDSMRSGKEMLLTIAASHYGFRNRNWTVYRHDTVRDDIQSFVAPTPKPIIQQHRPKQSDVYGHIIAADFKYTSYYQNISLKHKIEDLETPEYIQLMKEVILPKQKADPRFDGLAYLELVGRMTNKTGISKVLDREFISVSIGASPNRLICSECGQDQVVKMCDHYGNKQNNTFMLAESLNYKELSFVDTPADPFGRITRIHDGVEDEDSWEEVPTIDAVIDAIPLKDFFELTDKTIVCVNNICTIINPEGNMKKKNVSKVTLSFSEEFDAAKVKSIVDSFGDNATLQDLDSELPDNQFAIVQKTEDGLKRRFALCDAVNVRLGMAFLKDATDMSPTEKEKASTLIMKAAKKFGIEGEILTDAEVDPEDNGDGEKQITPETGTELTDEEKAAAETAAVETEEVDEVTKLTDSIKALVDKFVEENLDEEGNIKVVDADKAPESTLPSPIEVIFSCLLSLGNEIKYCGGMLESMISGYLKEKGKEAVSKETKDSYDILADEVKDLQDQVEMLDEQNMTLNKQLRDHYVDEVVSHKVALNLVDDADAEKLKCSKMGYETLTVLVSEFRNMRHKLTDAVVIDKTVNNNTEIKKVEDPTLVDSAEEGEDVQLTDQEVVDPKAEKKPMTKQDALAIIRSLRK